MMPDGPLANGRAPTPQPRTHATGHVALAGPMEDGLGGWPLPGQPPCPRSNAEPAALERCSSGAGLVPGVA